MKFYNVVVLACALVALFFFYFLKKTFDRLVGLEVEIVIDPPDVAIEKELRMLDNGWLGPPSYPDIPVMLWWTPFTADDGIQHCGDFKCFFTNDRSFRHHPMVKTIFFYGTDFKTYDVPIPRKQGEDWALLHEESPKNNPIFTHFDLIRHFNHTSSFKRQSHFPLTTQYLESIDYLTQSKYLVSIEEKNRLQKEGLAPVAYVQSGCDTPSMRDQYVSELMKFIPVDSYGTCLNNKELPSDIQGSDNFESEKFLRFLAQYKFVIAFENAICDDYVTEKLWRTLAIGSIPIYMGAPNVQSLLPNDKSAILVQDYASPAELATHIKKINSNDSEYGTYLQHKKDHNRGKSLIKNKNLVDMVAKRRWGVSRKQQREFGTFVAKFQCHVCEKVARNVKFTNIGFRPLPYDANADHFGCPSPVSPLTGEVDPNSWWNQVWTRAGNDAKAFHKLALKNEPFGSEQFHSVAYKLMEES